MSVLCYLSILVLPIVCSFRLTVKLASVSIYLSIYPYEYYAYLKTLAVLAARSLLQEQFPPVADEILLAAVSVLACVYFFHLRGDFCHCYDYDFCVYCCCYYYFCYYD